MLGGNLDSDTRLQPPSRHSWLAACRRKSKNLALLFGGHYRTPPSTNWRVGTGGAAMIGEAASSNPASVLAAPPSPVTWISSQPAPAPENHRRRIFAFGHSFNNEGLDHPYGQWTDQWDVATLGEQCYKLGSMTQVRGPSLTDRRRRGQLGPAPSLIPIEFHPVYGVWIDGCI